MYPILLGWRTLLCTATNLNRKATFSHYYYFIRNSETCMFPLETYVLYRPGLLYLLRILTNMSNPILTERDGIGLPGSLLYLDTKYISVTHVLD